MAYLPLQNNELFGSCEISFTDRRECAYPQLMRLSMDFEICILQIQCEKFNHITKRILPKENVFLLSDRNYRESRTVYSPRCRSLADLEVYACDHHVDILHEHLFGNLVSENDSLDREAI